jgi:hypothetical protein
MLAPWQKCILVLGRCADQIFLDLEPVVSVGIIQGVGGHGSNDAAGEIGHMRDGC